ncbi:glutathione S-transferase family protein [Chitinibacter bivalviorum]|uniref:Glutathione S-transferase family protein n=2 Tax=Chitinibacter bivalviorum TaxID=2739434 RepID=A0A7H9BN81_9NEIS|nr:glutathione S-transferase family protein [Chitinibacter bivalviorum]
MYQLYIANKLYSSWSLRPWLLLKQLAIPFTEQLVPFGEGATQPHFLQFSPTGKVPCLHDAERTIWDSLAITEYLAERHTGVWPQDDDARAWARCAAAEMHSGFFALRQQCGMHCGVLIEMAQIDAALQRDLDRVAALWQEGLSRFGGPFLAGARFSAVDAFFAPVAIRVRAYQLPLPTPAAEYAQRLLNLPAMQQWLNEALAEPWLEPSHETEILAAGRLVQDLRQP